MRVDDQGHLKLSCVRSCQHHDGASADIRRIVHTIPVVRGPGCVTWHVAKLDEAALTRRTPSRIVLRSLSESGHSGRGLSY
jgi:hypothetical protein